jgi:2'-hydroxyisoflavone reductase
MRILMLGGTSFVGRAIVADALRQGAELTLFSRGRTGTELFPEAQRLIGDRETGDYTALTDGKWDAVVDASGYQAWQVDQAMDALDGKVGRYVFISSHAVYARTGVGPGSDESTPRREPLQRADVLDNETYGRCKVACEDTVLARYGSRATILRPGKVVGPFDAADTFPYWVRRGARGGRVALPGSPEQPIQVTDSRDLARLVVQLITDDQPGAFNAVGPLEPATLDGVIRTAAEVAGAEVEIVPVPASAVPARFPLVLPEEEWPSRQRSSAKARAAGMPSTPLAVTIADVLAWDRDRGEPPIDAGLSPAEEAALVAKLSS